MFAKQKKKIVSTLLGAKEATGNFIYAAGLKHRQNKMIQNLVENKPSGLARPDRSQSRVVYRQEQEDKRLKDILRKKGLYK